MPSTASTTLPAAWGAAHHGEAFGPDYVLPNDGYCESCAACGMSFWADRMLRHHADAHYADVQERVLYNAILGAVELTGENFYYQNPLESDQARYPWHGCPCCVGNIPRALLAIKDLMYSINSECDTLYINHFVDSEGTIDNVAGGSLRIAQETGYPWKRNVTIVLHPERPAAFSLEIRVPNRTESEIYTADPEVGRRITVRVNGKPVTPEIADGYATIARTWRPGDRVEIELPMDVQRVYADRRVVSDRGRVALQRGPIVYNVEDVDHGDKARSLVLDPEAPLRPEWRDDLLGGVTVIKGKAKVDGKEVTLTAVPNFARLNRGGWSQVWITEDPEKIEPNPPSGREPFGLKVKPFPRPDLDPRTLDKVVVGDAASERRHHRKGSGTSAGVFQDRAWRHAAGGGWFSYEMKVHADEPNVLLVTYWGSDLGTANSRFKSTVSQSPSKPSI